MTEAANLWLPTADRIEAMLKPLHEFLLPAADLHNGETVIDVGGGTGSTTAAAAWDALQAPLQTGRHRDRAQPLLNHEHPQTPGSGRTPPDPGNANPRPRSRRPRAIPADGGRSRIRTWEGEADGFTARRSYPRLVPLTSADAVRGTIRGRPRPLCVRRCRVGGACGPRTGADRATDGAEKATDGAGGSGYADRPPSFLPLTWHFRVSNSLPTLEPRRCDLCSERPGQLPRGSAGRRLMRASQ
jgi:hypothetical protein